MGDLNRTKLFILTEPFEVGNKEASGLVAIKIV